MYYLLLVVVLLISFILFFFLINLKWAVKTIRSICSPANHGGYTKLIQLFLVGILSSMFVLIFFYYLLNHETVDRIDIFLTVIVGWLGAIIGRFFGERAMENLDNDRKNYAKNVSLMTDKYNHFLDEVISKLNKK